MDLIDWLLRDASRLTDAEFTSGFVSRLRQHGIPVDRLWIGTPRHNPIVASRALTWTADDGPGTLDLPWEMRDRMVGGAEIAAVASRSFRLIVLDDVPAGTLGLPDSLWAEGFTEVVVGMRLWSPYAGEGYMDGFFMTVSTKATFGDSVRLLDEIDTALAVCLRMRGLEDLLGTIARAYLGRDPARQVLAGRVHRGESATVRAAIAFADLRGFTHISETKPAEVVFDLLNDFFDVVVGAIEATGGDVLQFMGDGLLALWPEQGGVADPCDAALQAARVAERGLYERSADRVAAGKPGIEFALALHYGDVSYGNMGARQRLAFTALGPAVNQAARLESLAAEAGRCLVVSREFASQVAVRCERVASLPAKGIGEIEVWTLGASEPVIGKP